MKQKTKKILEEFEKRFGTYKIDDGELRQYSIWKDFNTFLISIIKSLIDQERNDIWKWIGENSWTINDGLTEKGEIRVIDVDELADYWRKQEHETQSKKD